jgi:hypothetical protein
MKHNPHHLGVLALALIAAAATCAAGAGGSVASASPRTVLARPGAASVRFGSALRYRAERLSRRGVAISFAGALPARAVRPARAVYTLTVRGIDLAGGPDTGDLVAVENVDNPAPLSKLLHTLHKFRNGTATVKVPAGTYWAVGIFSRAAIIGLGHPGGGRPAASNATRLVVLPQFAVSGNTTVTVDERTATSRLTVTTPRPAVTGFVTIAVERISAGGKRLTVSVSPEYTGPPVYVRPTSRAPSDGTLYSFTSDQLVSPAAATATYQYYLALKGPRGLVPAQHFRIRAASLATVRENLYSGARGTGSFTLFGGYAAEGGSGALIPRLAVPGRTTMYLSAGRSLDWWGQYTQGYPISGGQYELPVAYRPGQVISREWNAYPLHTAPNVRLSGSPGFGLTVISADRSGNTLTLDFMPFTDSVPGHLGTGYQPVQGGTVSGTYRIRQNGKTIAAGNALNSLGIPTGEFYRQVRLTAKPSVITFTLTAKRTGRLYSLSSATSTTWTWRSAHEAGATVPPGWTCSDAIDRDCRAEPLLTLAYAVSGLALGGTTAPGAQRLTVQAGHLQLAAAPKITKVTVQVSVNDGKTWTPATVTGSGGTYRARFAGHPGDRITLRVTAADAAGGQISETITRAYGIAS